MLNGIAKTIRKDNKIIFIDIESHNSNLAKICKTFSSDFVGNKDILEKAASMHDLWKSNTMNPEAILNGKNLFVNHGSEFPCFLIDKGFNEIEFDITKRKKHYEDYYTLNLIRLHHSGFNTYNLYRTIDFIYESDKDTHNEIMQFIRDWYALKTADWIDSAILSSIFQGTDLESDLKSDLEVAQEDQDSFYIVQEGALAGNLKLCYNFSSIEITRLKEIIKREKGKARRVLNSTFLEDNKDIREAILRGS